jgi:hypothetical protein
MNYYIFEKNILTTVVIVTIILFAVPTRLVSKPVLTAILKLVLTSLVLQEMDFFLFKN